jgi:thioredoxin 1
MLLMSGGDTKKSNKGIAVKIIIPIILICVIAGIWVVKNIRKDTVALGVNNADFALHVTEKIDLEKLKSYGLPIIIDFGADSCIPCKEMAPVLEKLNEELRGKAIIRFVDVWKYPELEQGFPISVIPTQVLFNKDGKPYLPSDENAAGMLQYTSKETKEHIFTIHEGGITEETLLKILSEMGMEE